MIDFVAALKRLKFPAYSAGHCRLGNNVAGQIVPFAHDSNKERVPAVFMHFYSMSAAENGHPCWLKHIVWF